MTFEEGQQLAAENDMMFIETSARTGNYVDASFQKMVERVLDKIANKEIDPYNGVSSP